MRISVCVGVFALVLCLASFSSAQEPVMQCTNGQCSLVASQTTPVLSTAAAVATAPVRVVRYSVQRTRTFIARQPVRSAFRRLGCCSR